MKKIFLVALFIHLFVGLFAQVSDDQVVEIIKKAHNEGKGQEEVIMLLTKKGVSKEQLLRIKEKQTRHEQRTKRTTELDSRERTKSPMEKEDQEKEDQEKEDQEKEDNTQDKVDIFGHDIFNNNLLSFEPNLNIATPKNYILGPGDEVVVDIWGDSEQRFRQKISPEGVIIADKIGPIYLSGLSIDEANARLKQTFAHIYATMNGSNPSTFMRLSLGEIRSIQVHVMGEVLTPGTYTLPSLASLFHSLYHAGGINKIGSLRSIQLNRNGKVFANIDIYDYLLKGKNDLDIQLQDGDVIVVSPYQNLISLHGKVKRPTSYEMQEEETIHDLLNYAGGFTGDAYQKTLRLIRKNGRNHQVFNIESTDFEIFTLRDGDDISVDSTLNRYENKVEAHGAFYREGLYALGKDVSTVKQLIEKAEGVRGDAFLNRAVIYREKPDRTLELKSIDLKGILENRVEDVQLQKHDIFYIPSIFDLQDSYTINVNGAVRFAGTYKFAVGMSIEDAVIQAGGLANDASVVRIDIARRIREPKSLEIGKTLSKNYTFTLKDGLIVDGEKYFTLEPYDEIFVRKSPMYHKQKNVSIEGEVLFEGLYTLSKKGERLSDLITRAGGLSEDAYINGARLIRRMNADELERGASLLRMAKQTTAKDSIDLSTLSIDEITYVGIELDKALQNPGSEYDAVLREGDILRIPTYTGTVNISGAVRYPNTVIYKKGADIKHYINQGGGFGDSAKKRSVFIVYMNGTVAQNKLFRRAKIEPGCEIIVPVKPPRKGINLSEIMSIASSTTSMAALVSSIINSTK